MNVFKKIKQRGQILLLYALMIPTLFFFVGVTFDLSWYYLNVARMQNAADAAVLAGAQKLIEQEGTLSDYNYTTFVNGFDGSKVSPSTRNTFNGDSIAKDYVLKNIASNNSFWASDTVRDVFTQKDLRFTGKLLGESNNNFDVLYYHIMLEEEVPHMMLGKFFPDMKAKVSSVAKITQFMKGYDLFKQIKLLEDKQTYSSWNDIYKQKNDSESAADARSVILSRGSDLEDNSHYTESADFPYNSNYLFDNLLIGTDPDAPQASNNSIDYWAYRRYREININTVYNVRNEAFYKDSSILSKARDENDDYAGLSDDELAQVLAKNTSDPLYVRIESEAAGEPVRQVIINVNVDNTADSARPIILFYDGPVYDESLPVILNINADFKGILFAPNSPVVINGNNHKLQGFVVAESYVQLADSGYLPIELNNNTIYVDSSGNVYYKKIGGSYETVDKYNLPYTYKLAAASQFDSFNQIWLEYNTVSTDNLFTTADANMTN